MGVSVADSTSPSGSAPRPLPQPYSTELSEALEHRGRDTPAHERIYSYLFEYRNAPPTDAQIADYFYADTGQRPTQLDRRRREVGEVFQIEQVRTGREVAYRLVGWRAVQLARGAGISQRDRFVVLQAGRCAKCGRTVADDGVKLVVDHVIPQAWGGTDSLDNYQALCQECNAGKKDFYGSFDEYADQIREAVNYDEPHRRIAMLLKATEGEWIPSDLIGAVASAKQFQEDWQKRMRELRELGLQFEMRKKRLPSGRVTTEWKLARWKDLPNEPLAPLIRRLEREKKLAK
ncbi:HNH endonuclease [Gryllotalpicola koreensis]